MFDLHIDLRTAVVGLNDLVQRFGADHRGDRPDEGSCVYVDRVEGVRLIPSCIVGQFFADLGVLRVLLSEVGVGDQPKNCPLSNEGGLSREVRDRLADKYGITMDDEAYTLLSEAQGGQDNGRPWGKAVEAAAQYVEDKRGGTPVPNSALGRLLAEVSE